MIAADFNGDGKSDLATANGGSEDVSVLLGHGDGTFAVEQRFAAGRSAYSMTAGDFNGDGKSDLAVVSYRFGGGISVMLGRGDGTFEAEQDFAAGRDPMSVIAVDLNGDGKTDLATANSRLTGVSVLLGRGDGTFATQQGFAAGGQPASVIAGDFNGDGKYDLATANIGSDDVSVLIGRGDGTFEAPQQCEAGTGPLSVTVVDLNGDGRIDLVTANFYSDDVSVMLGRGDGTFATQQQFAVGYSPRSVIAADLDGDGKNDLATANSGSGDVSVLIGRGNGTFEVEQRFAAGSRNRSVVAADFNKDGQSDLATANSGSHDVSVLLGRGDRTFVAHQRFGAGAYPWSVVAADLNGDSKTDLATTNYGVDEVSVLVGRGDGTFGAPQQFAAWTNPSSAIAADFNGDSKIDLATANSESNNLSVLLGRGDGTFAGQQRFAVGTNPSSVIAGDFNGDSKTDLAAANSESNNLSVLVGRGDGTFAGQQRFAVGSSPWSVIAVDLNGDGHSDLATANFESSDVSVLLGRGDGTFATQQRFAVGSYSSPYSVIAADLNGDGQSDLITANYSLDDVSVLSGHGDGTFDAPRRFVVGSGPRSVIVTDLNGDGQSDLITVNHVSEDVSVLLGREDGTFAAEQRFAAGSAPYSVVAADFNGDGKIDLATANEGSHDVAVLLQQESRLPGAFDLVVTSASPNPASLQLGIPVRLSYQVTNRGTLPTPERWVDGIWISADSKLDSSDIFLAQIPRKGALAAGESYMASLDLVIPPSVTLQGTAHILVQADAGYDITEGSETNNLTGAAVVIVQQVTTLVLGQPYIGTLRAGEAVFFEVNPMPGEPFSINLSGLPVDGSVALYLRRGAWPTRSDYERAVTTPFTPGKYLYLSVGQRGPYYIMVEARTLATSPASFQLTVSNPSFGVRAVRFGTGGNAGNYTIRAIGDRLTPATTARLVNGQGFSRPALANWYGSESEIYSTFDLRGVAPGIYDVAFSNGAAESVVVPQSLIVVAADEPSGVIPRLITPGAVRRDRAYNFIVEWENTSLNDVLPPLLTVEHTTAFGWASGDDSLGTGYTFLGIATSGAPGILRPGQRETVTFWAKSGPEDGSYVASVDRFGKEPETAFDWAAAIRSFRPEAMTDTQAAILAAELGAAYGHTQGGYLKALAAFANAEWERIRNPGELLHREVLRAWSRISSGVWGTVSGMNPPSDGHVVRIEGGESSLTRSTRTDRLGRFHFSDLANGNYRLAVERAALANPAQGNVALAGGNSAGPVNLAVSPAAQFVVQIDVQDRTPMANATVIPSRDGTSFDPAGTDAAGVATFYGLELGTYDLTIFDGQGEFRRAGGVVVPQNPQAVTHLDLAQATVRGTLPPGSNWRPVLVPAEAGGRLEFIPARIEQNQFTIPAPVGDYRVIAFDDAGNRVSGAGPWQIQAGDNINVGQLAGVAQSAPRRALRSDSQVRWLEDPGVREYFKGNFNPVALDLIEWFDRDPDKVWAEMAPQLLLGLIPTRGYEFASVVRDYLNVDGRRHRFFTNGSSTVEGPWALYNPGFRKHERTKTWLYQLANWSAIYLRMGIQNGVFTVEPGDEKDIDILGIAFQRLITNDLALDSFHQDGNTPENRQTLVFDNTLAGGVGHYGTPPGPLTPDFREITNGTIHLSRDCNGLYRAQLRDIRLHVHDAFDLWPGDLGDGSLVNYATTILAFLEINNRAWDVALDIEWTDRETRTLDLGELSRKKCGETCEDRDGSKCIERPRSFDPNDITGPAGVGPENHVFGEAVMPYTIRFENHATQASAPAAMVTITQQLDANLDWTTFRLGDIGFGDTVVPVPPDAVSYETRVDLREKRGVFVDIRAGLDVATGKVSWEFTAIDPVTGGLPEDPLVGFLPPNVTAPEGEGFVNYIIYPKRPALSGTRIDAVASIVFDVNAPIITPAIFHTLDEGPPSVEVWVNYTKADGRNVEVFWQGNDNGGVGITSYDVSVSVNGGPFVPWLTDTQEMLAVYSGLYGQHLEFRVTARDLLGQRSSSPATAAAIVGGEGSVTIKLPGAEAAPVESQAVAFTPLAAGNYAGLLLGQEPDAAARGFFAATVTKKGGLTGALRIGGSSLAFKGALAADGSLAATATPTKDRSVAFDLALRQTATGGFKLVGSVTDTFKGEGTVFSAALQKGASYSTKNPSPLAGRYTMLAVSDQAMQADEPEGHGFAVVNVAKTGKVTATGRLADGTRFAQGGVISVDGEWPFFVDLYSAKPRGFLASPIRFRDVPGISDFDGTALWWRPALPKSPVFKPGFTVSRSFIGSAYTKPAKDALVLRELPARTGNAALQLRGSPLVAGAGPWSLTWNVRHQLLYSGTEKITVSVTPASGAFSGNFSTKTPKMNVGFGGVIFQKQGFAGGCFTTPSFDGEVTIDPQ